MTKFDRAVARTTIISGGLLALITAPFVVAGGAVGCYASFKVSNKIAQDKYGPRDIGGIGPSMVLCLSAMTAGTLAGGYIGSELSDVFSDKADAQSHTKIVAATPTQHAVSFDYIKKPTAALNI